MGAANRPPDPQAFAAPRRRRGPLMFRSRLNAFLAALIVDGALAGSIYALIALGFVVVYRPRA